MPRLIPALYRLKRPRTIGNTRNLLKKMKKKKVVVSLGTRLPKTRTLTWSGSSVASFPRLHRFSQAFIASPRLLSLVVYMSG